ncbi:MAG: NADH-quinone oxidoreductase subunit NuoE [Armatimonadetes bacterium]|nr:NADH-quinone oxidoreductase subunit NuoE [Armatimonadota bacterium]
MAHLTAESRQRINDIAARYPEKRSALLPALYVAQEQDGIVTDEAIIDIAELLEATPAYVKGVASFYTMYYRYSVGKYILQVCGTLSCELCGSGQLVNHLEERLGIKEGETTPDGRFTFETVECLGACGGAPVMLLGDKYYEKLTIKQLDAIIDDLRFKPASDHPEPPQLVPFEDKPAGAKST